MTEAGLAASLLVLALVTAAATGPFPALLPLAAAAVAGAAGLTRHRLPLRGRAEVVLWLPGLAVVLWGLVDPFATGIGREGSGAALSGASTVLLGYGLFLAVVVAWSDVGARVEKFLCVALGIMVVLGRVPFDPTFAGLTTLFGVLGAWFLVLRRRGTMAGAREARALVGGATPPASGPALWVTLVHGALAAALALAMAVALPPLERWSVEALVEAAARRSGFSAVTDLNAVGPLTLSRTIVMRVDSPQEPPPMRGAVYDRYVFGRWLSSRRAFVAKGRKAPGAVEGATALAGTVVEAEDDALAILFGPLGLQGVRVWDDDECELTVHWDGTGVPRAPGAVRWVWDGVPPAAGACPPTPMDLRIPDDVPDEFRQLAASAAPAAATTVEVVAGVAALFDDGYAYSLDRPPPPPGADPVCDFAVRSRQGHCELFASATVLLLRCRGIPARYVTGFHCHERNPLTGLWIVRERNAHAWVEVWMPRRGWQTLDTTPPGSAEPPEGSPGLAWVEYFVAWAMRGIRGLVRALQRFELAGLLRGVGALVRRLLGSARGLATLAAAGLLLLALLLLRRRRGRREDPSAFRALTEDQLRARALLEGLERVWAARGLARGAGETADELRRRCRKRGGQDAALVALTEEIVGRFDEVRYGCARLPADEAAELAARLTSR